MARGRFLTLVAAGLVAAGGFGGLAAQALSAGPAADPPAGPGSAASAADAPEATTRPVDEAHIDEFFLQDQWHELRQVARLTQESCMAEAGFPFDGTTFDGMPSGLSEVDQDTWQAAADPCRELGSQAMVAAEAAYVPTAQERAAASAFAAQYQVWIDEMRTCMTGRGHEFVGAVDPTLHTAPYVDSDRPAGMPDGLSLEERHEWIVDAYAYDSTSPEWEQGTWDEACVTVADAVVFSGAGH